MVERCHDRERGRIARRSKRDATQRKKAAVEIATLGLVADSVATGSMSA
jgi:hypothetical protein